MILFLEPDVTWVQDGGRSEEIAADRIKFSEQIKEFYHSFGFEFVSIHGDYGERFDQAVKLVNQLIK